MNEIFTWIGDNIWIVSIFTLVLGAYLNTFLTKNKEILMKIADKKSQYYADFVNSLLNFNKSDYQRLIANDKDEINRNYFYMKNLVILYGSSEVIEKLSICEKIGINFDVDEGREIYLDLIEAMKKDVENPKIINFWWKKKFGTKDKRDNIGDILFGYKKKNDE
ncbi:hypothetical protein [Cytobacillus kochii]|uniref:hypothetical protein n=1 Tax=Cytobacillus kochii TaxID=859143 RepID=UPI00402A7753